MNPTLGVKRWKQGASDLHETILALHLAHHLKCADLDYKGRQHEGALPSIPFHAMHRLLDFFGPSDFVDHTKCLLRSFHLSSRFQFCQSISRMLIPMSRRNRCASPRPTTIWSGPTSSARPTSPPRPPVAGSNGPGLPVSAPYGAHHC